MQIRKPKTEDRKKPEARTPRCAALSLTRSRSAELHSAVSQICNLRRVGANQRDARGGPSAEYNSAIQQIENLRYDAVSASRAGQPSAVCVFVRDSGFLRRGHATRSAELHSAVSQICNLRGVGTARRVARVRPSAEYNSAIQQIENLRYDVLSACRAGRPSVVCVFVRDSRFLRRGHATRSAELDSAVSQICNLRCVGTGRRVARVRPSAEYNSAIRQIENLRCGAPRLCLVSNPTLIGPS
jgi:hypothetical protein